MFVSRRRGAVITTLLQDTPHTLMPAAPAGAGSNCRQPLDFMLATLVGNGAAWSVATLPAIKVNSHPFRRLVKVRPLSREERTRAGRCSTSANDPKQTLRLFI